MKVHRWDDSPSSNSPWPLRLTRLLRSPPPRMTLLLVSGGLFLVLIALWTLFYTVDPHERAVVTRFGEVVRIAEPGLHFKWPLAIERVRLVSTERVLKQEFGFRTKGTDRDGRTEYEEGNFEDESLMLTGDLNLINVEWVVQYRIADPIEYLYAMREPDRALRDAAESIMRRIVGNRIGSEVLTVGRVEISAAARDELHAAMKQAKNGLHVVTVELQDVVPPTRVKSAFNDVNEARQERERMINEATKLANEAIPKEEGQALRTIAEAEGYAVERVNRAKGEASRFTAVLAEYRSAPQVTRARLYLESLTKALPQVGSVIVVEDEASSPLPVFNLPGSQERLRNVAAPVAVQARDTATQGK